MSGFVSDLITLDVLAVQQYKGGPALK